MEHISTQAIILNTFDYTDSQIIVHAFTAEMGRLSFIVSKKKKNRTIQALLQPLFLVEIVFIYNSKRELQRLNTICLWKPYTDIPCNVGKTLICFFLAELLTKTAREQIKDRELFDFCVHSFELFDQTQALWNGFHLSFMIHLAKYIGFYPTYGLFDNEWRNFTPIITELTKSFLNTPIQNYTQVKHTRIERQQILTILIEYYQKNLPIGKINSNIILQQL